MRRQVVIAATAAALVLSACGDTGTGANVTTIVDTGDENVVVPGDNETAPVPVENFTDAHEVPALKLAADGLVLLDLESGARKSVKFGSMRGSAVPSIASALGKPTGQSVNQECGAGPLGFVDFQGGLSLLFEGDKFSGWSLDGRDGAGYATEGGLGIGTPRNGFGKPVKVEESTLGQEFEFEGIGGLLDGAGVNARVTNLWAGVTCMFR